MSDLWRHNLIWKFRFSPLCVPKRSLKPPRLHKISPELNQILFLNFEVFRSVTLSAYLLHWIRVPNEKLIIRHNYQSLNLFISYGIQCCYVFNNDRVYHCWKDTEIQQIVNMPIRHKCETIDLNEETWLFGARGEKEGAGNSATSTQLSDDHALAFSIAETANFSCPKWVFQQPIGNTHLQLASSNWKLLIITFLLIPETRSFLDN